MNCREILLNLVKVKRDVINTFTGTDYYLNQGDIGCIEKWDDECCDRVVQSIKDSVLCDTEVDLCTNPWCYKEGYVCLDCTYGLNHIVCRSETSDYQKLLRICNSKGINNINNIPGLKESIIQILFGNPCTMTDELEKLNEENEELKRTNTIIIKNYNDLLKTYREDTIILNNLVTELNDKINTLTEEINNVKILEEFLDNMV